MHYLNDSSLGIGPNCFIDMYEADSLNDFNRSIREGNIRKPAFKKYFNPINYGFGNPRDVILVGFRNIDISMEGEKAFSARDLSDELYVLVKSRLDMGNDSDSLDLLSDGRLVELYIRYSLKNEKAVLHMFKKFGPPVKDKQKSSIGLENCVTFN